MPRLHYSKEDILASAVGRNNLAARKTSRKPQKRGQSPDLPSKPNGLVEFFAESPLAKAKIELEREPDYGREVDL
jgi:hypothetical protein